ncbi:hypothetical protein [Pendulispora albinea]|uniref:Uncharacterized protein n=1 Tax=Pendulispora albinea TaxID=2741071 RepID=A0ABZ2LPW9_9BACT
MDCEKFESTLMDELYDELDELTSAASKRHVAGCARCASLLHGLSATRRIAVLERVEPPPGLEERILAATKEAQKVVPLRGRISRVVSWAGSWAMRPQTAMAAVFLLMIGSTSILLLRARANMGVGGAAMVVTEKGEPAASAPADEENAMDPAHAAGAHGAIETRNRPPPPAAAAPPMPMPMVAEAMGEKKDEEYRKGGEGRAGLEAADSKERARGPVALAPSEPSSEVGFGLNAAAPAGAPAPPATSTSQRAPQQPAFGSGGGSKDSPPAAIARADKPAAAAAPMAKRSLESAPAETKQQTVQQAATGTETYATAMAAYQARNYDEATRVFDALAASGDTSAALMAARSVRDSGGCAKAVSRFDQVSTRAYGSRVGYDATFEAGVCYRNMGSTEAARNHFAQLLTVPSHAARAQAQLDAMNPQRANRVQAPTQAAPPAKKSPIDADSK